LQWPIGPSRKFRSFGYEPLAAIGVTMPPWPGEAEAYKEVAMPLRITTWNIANANRLVTGAMTNNDINRRNPDIEQDS
jgi:hypothetical protein